jgi:hypothetical protein
MSVCVCVHMCESDGCAFHVLLLVLLVLPVSLGALCRLLLGLVPAPAVCFATFVLVFVVVVVIFVFFVVVDALP